MSQVAGAKLAHENPAIADLSNPNRPTKVGEKNSQLYDNEWTEAYTALLKDENSASDEKLTGYLYSILIDSYRFCEGVRKTQKKRLEDILFHPAVNMESGLISQMKDLSEILAKHLSDATKMSGDVASLNMVQAFAVDKDMKTKHGKRMQQCKAFIEECVKLCWLMHVQTPPLCIDTKTTKGEHLEKEKYKEYTRKGQKIAFVVWPALFLHEKGPLVAKGVAQGE
ncbi:hypothetical protein CHS0354_000016 [Potamilus streckersoni]|uniref:Mitochondria-eating protein n=1 Tax=Potamilus streckersoni TaxID=2493646 RepID=A0AAE0SA48_9BIVA|nr:hypothetical protein CHS0354_000016 [Potamilus streckersoni]